MVTNIFLLHKIIFHRIIKKNSIFQDDEKFEIEEVKENSAPRGSISNDVCIFRKSRRFERSDTCWILVVKEWKLLYFTMRNLADFANWNRTERNRR